MKRLVSLMLVCCLLLCGTAVADVEIEWPEVVINLGENAVLESEADSTDSRVKTYTVDDLTVYLMIVRGEYTAEEYGVAMIGEDPEYAMSGESEDSLRSRFSYATGMSNMVAVLDIAACKANGFTVLLMTMEHGAAYDQETIMDMMDIWLVTMTVDGEPVIPEEETVENE